MAERDAERGRGRRRLAQRALVVIAAAALLGTLLAVLGLRSAGVRQTILERVAASIEETTGLAVTATDFSVRLSPGTITLTDLALRASADATRPFLTIPRTTVRVRWRSLLSDRVVLPALVAEGPRLDLGAPMPQASGNEDDEVPGRTFDLPSIEISGGSILGAAPPESWAALLDAWRVEDARIAGSYRSGAIAAEVGSARVVLDSDRRPAIVLALSGAWALDDDGFAIDALEVDHEALRLRGKGRRSEARGALSLELQAEPAELFPDLAASGSIELSADASLSGSRFTANVLADVRQLPGEILEPVAARLWTATEPRLLTLAGTTLDVDADLALDLAIREDAAAELTAVDLADQVSGKAKIGWRRRSEELLVADLRSLDPPPDGGMRLAFEADVLPASPGRRHLVGELSAPGWRMLADGSLRRARLELDLEDLAATAARFGVDPAALGVRLFGELRATVAADGPLRGPRLVVDASWRDGGETLAILDLRTLNALDHASVRLRAAAELLPGNPGRRELAAEILTGDLLALVRGEAGADWRAWGLADARLDLDLPDVAGSAEELTALWRRLLPDRAPPEVSRPRLLAGTLSLEARADGPLTRPEVEFDGRWRPAPDEDLRFTGRGVASAQAPFFSGTTRWQIAAFDLERFAASEAEPELAGRVTGDLDFEGTLAEHRAELELEVSGLRLGSDSEPLFSRLRLAARSDGAALEIRGLDGTLANGLTFSGRGRVGLPAGTADWRPRSLDLSIDVPRPITTLERVAIRLGLDDDQLQAEITSQRPGEPPRAVAVARAPLTLLGLPAAASEVNADTPEESRRTVRIGLSDLELDPFLPLLGLGEDAPQGSFIRPQVTFDGLLFLDLDDLLASRGTIEASGVALETELGIVTAQESLHFELADRRLVLRPTRLLSSLRGTAAMVISGSFDLAAPDSGQEGARPIEVRNLDLDLDGSFSLAALDPLLAGGRASGEAVVDLRIHGPPAAPRVDGRIDGSAASLSFPALSGSRIEAPVAELSAAGGNTFLEVLRARLNNGWVEVTGDLGQSIDLFAVFEGVRYRLDHGLTVIVSGDLAYERPPPPGSRALLSGAVTVERGTLRRDLAVDRELLSLLLAPDMTSTEEQGGSEDIDLDLVLTTAEGLRIKNNLADLRADWGRLRVRGTLANPLVSGRIDVDPGGKITAYGQTVRIDEASAELSGDPAVGPRLNLELTSSLEDPSLGSPRGGLGVGSLGDRGPGAGSYWDAGDQPTSDRSRQVTEGVLTYYSDRLAGTLSQGLEGTQLSLEPLPLFGETDTQARLTATQRLSRVADLIYSVNPREAEGQTYILDLHDFDFAPRFSSQLFTNDQDNAGFTVVQTLELGGHAGSASAAPRLERIVFDAPDEVSERRVRRALSIHPGDPLAEDATFELELDALEELRRQGYPGASVKLSVEPLERRRELRIEVEPGPRVSFDFEGDKPSSAARRRIAQIYRPADETSLDEMRRETVQALRLQGHLDPRVTVTAEGDSAAGTVRVEGEGGPKISAARLELQGVDDGEAAFLAAQFESRLARVELAAGVEGADRYLLRSLRALGYPRAAIVSRGLSDDGRTLAVRLDRGPRQHLELLEIAGVPAPEAERLKALLPIRAGDPVRSAAITRSAHLLEDDLRQRGFVDARVRTELEPLAEGSSPDDELVMALRFEVERGSLHRVAGVRFEGLRGTRASWAEHLVDLEHGEVFRDREVGDARRRLARTRLFERIRVSTETSAGDPPDGTRESASAGPAVDATVVFEVEERPRYRVAYGGRWESAEGAGVVVEAVDGNFLGRGSTFGTRAIFSGDERSLRFYHSLPRIAGTRGGLEIFLEGKEEELEGSLVDGVESWVQHTFPVGRQTSNRIYLRYQDFVVREPAAGSEALLDQRFVIPSLGWQLNFDNRERAIGARPSDGLAFGLDLSGSDRALGSDVSTLALFSQVKLFRSFARDRGPHGLTWAQWWRIGLLETSGATAVPTVNRLRAGGEYSVRGYRRNSLGPLDADGDALGGEAFFLVNQELHFPLWGDKLSGLAFFDAGNVWETREAIDSELFTSVGLGLRASTPLGPLRLDVALPLDRRPGDDDFKIYVGFGNIF